MTLDGEKLGSSVESEVWELLDADDAVADETVYLVAAALQGDEELADQLGGDLPSPTRPDTQSPAASAPLRAFLRSITVSGFRGIGPRATLELNPYRGITVISGRNGCGKSSFAEALEYALTGESYRFANRAKHWRDSWRNLHSGNPTAIEVDFAMEPDDDRSGSKVAIGADWAAGADLSECRRWSQIHGQKREPVSALGWDQALLTHRPLMSYDELGGLLEDGPSNLYDALNRLLGLDQIADADSRLKGAEKQLGIPRKTANDSRTQLIRTLEESEDPRAAEVKKLIARKPYDLDAVTATTLGTATDQAVAIARLRAIADLDVIDPAKATEVAAELRSAIDAHADGADAVTKAMTARATLLREALHLHAELGGGPCPVCEMGTLDGEWKSSAEQRLKEADAKSAEYQKMTQRLARARAAADGFFAGVATVPAVDGVDLESLSAFNDAVTEARSVPGNLADLPSHVESSAAALAEAVSVLRAEAATLAADLEDAWAPIARVIAAWVDLEAAARIGDNKLAEVQVALKWLRANAETLRGRRLAPVVDQAREIWGRMRHESNVDLGGISLEGSANRRKAVVEGSVDGVPAGALSVMSQGELHALALALFIPRATTPDSPFRFLVLDDPIQAMDPAKIDGFLDVLVELSKTRQVIVFSHDDRLPAAIRARSIPAQLLDVTREEGSVVVVKQNDSPAQRYIADATAVILDDSLDDMVKRKAAPGLFRMAVEAAAHQRFFTDSARAGAVYHESDALWEEAKTTQQRVALAVTGSATGDLSGWKRYRTHRFPTMAICASGAHNGAALDRTALQDLRETVRDIAENR
ncbi:AAA family ATPase [Mycolicibacterium crocinum]|uniref:Nuclease SbcCD subunit C n=1 Tax=Mycolicibacterium crocinum TaxID=388459 RepID=A0ABY3TQW3_9MYCO|nr:ATP-binding protein [Mycolicibacterium crocinum]ULN42473.1 AAA family ATPase [Mycolicibacterium crocinum]